MNLTDLKNIGIVCLNKEDLPEKDDHLAYVHHYYCIHTHS